MAEQIFTGDPWSERLNELAALELGWYDGSEGQPVNLHSLVRTDLLLDYAVNTSGFGLPFIAASFEDTGGIVLEWHMDRCSYNSTTSRLFSIDVRNDSKFDCFYTDISDNDDSNDRYLENVTDYYAVLEFIDKYLPNLY